MCLSRLPLLVAAFVIACPCRANCQDATHSPSDAPPVTVVQESLRNFADLARNGSDISSPGVAKAAMQLRVLLSEGTSEELLRYQSQLPNVPVARALTAVRLCALSREKCAGAIGTTWPDSFDQMAEIYNSTALPNDEFPDLSAAHQHFYELGERVAESGKLSPVSFLKVMAEFGTGTNADDQADFVHLVNRFKKKRPKAFSAALKKLTPQERNLIEMYENNVP